MPWRFEHWRGRLVRPCRKTWTGGALLAIFQRLIDFGDGSPPCPSWYAAKPGGPVYETKAGKDTVSRAGDSDEVSGKNGPMPAPKRGRAVSRAKSRLSFRSSIDAVNF